MQPLREGNYLERLAVVEKQIEIIEANYQAIAKDIRIIRDTLSEAKGGWRVMLLVAGSAGTVGAFIGKWLSTIIVSFPK